MGLSDKIRRTALTLAVGSIGAVVGYLADEAGEFIGEKRQKSITETKDPPSYTIQEYHSKSGIIYFDGTFAF